MEEIKLVIWDLDETFWNGTLTAGDITPVIDNIDLVKKFTSRGIINSICSKNDYNEVEKVLTSDVFQNINDYFVFKSIDWTPKGGRVKNIISDMNLRPVNCLFVDDNINNLKEVQFQIPEINICLYCDFHDLIVNNPKSFEGKNDSEFSRLSQYKILFEKVKDRKIISSNQKFLEQSDIKVFMIEQDNDLSRIYEMIHRNNQLNFTKNRITMDEVKNIFTDSSIRSGMVKVVDKYGDNGIVGCYALKDNVLIQFVFSCRILGMGVEKYVYQQLNWPDISIKGEVASSLIKGEVISYINKEQKNDIFTNSKAYDEYFIAYGECPLRPIWYYLQNNFKKAKFNEITPNPSVLNLGRMFSLSDSQVSEILLNVPLFHSEWTYDIDIRHNNFKYLLLSLINENSNYKYSSTVDDTIFYCKQLDNDIKNSNYLHNFVETPVTLDDIELELKSLLLNISNQATLFFITSSEVVFKKDGEDANLKFSIDSNKLLEKLTLEFSNIKLIDIRKYTKTELDFFEPVRNHYNREIGYYLYNDIMNYIQSSKDSSLISNLPPPSHYTTYCHRLFKERISCGVEYVYYICNFKLHFEITNKNFLIDNNYKINIKLYLYRYELLSTTDTFFETEITTEGAYRIYFEIIKDDAIVDKKSTQFIDINCYNIALYINPNNSNYSNAINIMDRFIQKSISLRNVTLRQLEQLFFISQGRNSLDAYFSKFNIDEVSIYFSSLNIAKLVLSALHNSRVKIKNLYSIYFHSYYDEINDTTYKFKNIDDSLKLSADEYFLVCAPSGTNFEISFLRKKNCKFLWLDNILSYLLTWEFSLNLVNKFKHSLFIALRVCDFNQYLVKATSTEKLTCQLPYTSILEMVRNNQFDKLPSPLRNFNFEELKETMISVSDFYDKSNFKFNDRYGCFLNVKNGIRVTVGQPDVYVGTIYLIGDSRIFGVGVSDANTVASILQKIIDLPFRVVNNSNVLYGRDLIKGLNYFLNNFTPSNNDIIVFITSNHNRPFANQGQNWLDFDAINENIVKVDLEPLFRTFSRPDYFTTKETYSSECNTIIANSIKRAIYSKINFLRVL